MPFPDILTDIECYRKGLNLAFMLNDPLGNYYSILKNNTEHSSSVNYSQVEEVVDCDRSECELLKDCACSRCKCCSFCTEFCPCTKATRDANGKLAAILDLGDQLYR